MVSKQIHRESSEMGVLIFHLEFTSSENETFKTS